jgi:lysozyme
MNKELLKQELARDEGLRLRPYKCSAGRTSIGYGRNLDDVGISEAEALALLDADIARAEAGLDRIAPWWSGLSDNRQRVLLNMCFNLGEGRLAGFKKFLAACQAGEFDRAATEMRQSAWADQVGERARRLIVLMQHG